MVLLLILFWSMRGVGVEVYSVFSGELLCVFIIVMEMFFWFFKILLFLGDANFRWI